MPVIDLARARIGRRTGGEPPPPPTNLTQLEAALVRDAKGRARPVGANVLAVLALHPEWAGVVAYDEFHEQVVCLRPPPTRPIDAPASKPGDPRWGWCEEDTTRMCAWLSQSLRLDISTQTAEAAVATAARRLLTHPIRDPLLGYCWDRQPRLLGMLATYLGADRSAYTEAVSLRMLVAAVARVCQPGCQVDSMVVLEGEQGTGKTTAIRILAGAEHYSNTPVVMGDKDSYQALRGVWLYELAEMASLRGRDIERSKAWISQRVDHYRPSFGRVARDFPRQCVFIGTTNESAYLEDATGNRRFWPVRTGAIDLAGLERDREQIWAEAAYYYHEGQAWWLDDPALVSEQAEQAAGRLASDDWEGCIQKFTSTRKEMGVTVADLLTDCLGMKLQDITRGHSMRVGKILTILRWSRRQVRTPWGREWRYFPL